MVEITTDQPRNGNGSLRMEVTGGNKAAATFGGNRFFGGVFNLGTFESLLNGGSLGFDFYRDSSSTSLASYQPALEITFNNGAALKWEAVYNGNNFATDTWHSISLDADTGKFWQFSNPSSGGGSAFQNPGLLNLTLREWLTYNVGSTGRPTFSNETQITGISVQLGSGWNGNFVGFVDNVFLNAGSTAISANFEVIPSPAAAGGGLALLGMGALRRRTHA